VRKILTFVFLSLIICTLTNCAKQKLRGATIVDGTLSVGVEIGYPPMEYYEADGVTLAGFDIELTNALAENLGLQVNYIDTAWEGILAGLDSNRYDIAVNITILPKRQERYNFTRPYIDSSMTIVVLKNFPKKIERPQDIQGLKVSYQSDTTAQYFTEGLREQGVMFTSFSYDKIINCFNDLGFGRVDVVVVDNIVAFNYTEREDSPFKVVWQGPSGEHIGICLKKGNDALTSALDNALEKLFADGTLVNISQKIFNRDLVSSLWE